MSHSEENEVKTKPQCLSLENGKAFRVHIACNFTEISIFL